MLLWSRTAVSDGLLSGTLALSLLCQWRCHATGGRRWWLAWVVLGLAVLTKGPVAVVLSGITLLLFGLARRNLAGLWCQLRPLPGLTITALIDASWYGLELLVEGQPFWDSFFGYHNFQRFTSVVNSHLQPWWFFGPVLLVAALPFTPLLCWDLRSCCKTPGAAGPACGTGQPAAVRGVLVAGGVVAVHVSGHQASQLLVAGYTGGRSSDRSGLVALNSTIRRAQSACWLASVLLAAVLASAFWGAGIWVPLINDPEMPTLPAELLASGFVLRAAVCMTVAVLLGAWLWWRPQPGRLLAMQGPLVFQLVALVPIMLLGDRVRQLPVRQVADVIARTGTSGP